VAAKLKQELGIDAALVVGNPGELSIWIDDQKVVEKQGGRFPEPKDVIAAVRAHAP
jgi:predicted Rdx family selenoprotein